MIDTDFAESPYTTDVAAERLKCSRGNTTRKIQGVAERIVNAAMADPSLWATSGRPDRAARGFTEFVLTAGALAAGDPAAFQLWVRKMLERQEG